MPAGRARHDLIGAGADALLADPPTSMTLLPVLGGCRPDQDEIEPGITRPLSPAIDQSPRSWRWTNPGSAHTACRCPASAPSLAF